MRTDSNSRRVVFDSIIFGLQRHGGISNYWARLLALAMSEPSLEARLLLPRQILYSGFDPAWIAETASFVRERLPVRFARYLPVPLSTPGGVFHTSYYRLPRGRVSRYIVSAYDFTYERYRRGVARYVHTSQKAASLRRADTVLCISECTRRDAIEFCKGIDPARLHVTHLGVDFETFFRDPPPGAPCEDTVLFVGQRAGYKRFDLAVGAVRQCPRLRLGVVGPPLSREERELLNTQLGARWHEFAAVSNAQLRRLYSGAFAFIFPSDYEGFGLPVLESMACGCPVVAADRSSLPEVGGTAARYARAQRADDYATLLESLSDSAQREAAMSAGFARAARFGWSDMLASTLRAYVDS
jgi:mannosyltransferase